MGYGASGERVVLTETSRSSSGAYAVSKLDARYANVPYYRGSADTYTSGGGGAWTDGMFRASTTNPSGSISAYSQALDDYVMPAGLTPSSYGSSAKSSVSLTGESELEYSGTASSVGSTGYLFTQQVAYPGACSPSSSHYDNGATGSSVTFTEVSDDNSGHRSSSYLNAKDAEVPFYWGWTDTYPSSSASTHSHHQTLAGVTDPCAASITAYSQALDDYVKATEATPSSYGASAKSSVSMTSAGSLESISLDYNNIARSDTSFLHTVQQAFQGAGTWPSSRTDGATGGGIAFTESSYDKDNKEYAASYLKANFGSVPYYKGTADTAGKAQTESWSATNLQSAGSISAYSYA